MLEVLVQCGRVEGQACIGYLTHGLPEYYLTLVFEQSCSSLCITCRVTVHINKVILRLLNVFEKWEWDLEIKIFESHRRGLSCLL